MIYLSLTLKVLLIEYLVLLISALIHYIFSLLLKLKIAGFYIIPFNIYKVKSKYKFKISLLENNIINFNFYFNFVNLSSKLDYFRLLKKLKLYFWISPILDFSIFIILFSIGITTVSHPYFLLASIIHFSIATINFFNHSGKKTIGATEDERLAFNLIRDYTICGNGIVTHSTKGILTDMHMYISNKNLIKPFDINDLWNFLNNISFYKNSLISYINKDIFILHPYTLDFFNQLEKDFYIIKKYDYRQSEKVSIALLYYYIFKKINDDSFTPRDDISKSMLSNFKYNYYKYLYNLYFNNDIKNMNYLLNIDNMPTSILTREGYRKLMLKLIYIYQIKH